MASWKDLLFRTEENVPQEEHPLVQELKKTEDSNPSSSGGISSSFVGTMNSIVDKGLVGTLIKDFRQTVEDNNKPGVDFLEFTEALFETSANPSSDDYRNTFKILKIAEKSLTPSYLIETSTYYKNLVSNVAKGITSKGEEQRKEVEKEKTEEKTALETERTTLNGDILRLEKELESKKKRKEEISTSLEGIDKKYQPELDEIEKKLNAVKTASEQVIESFVDIEAGIQEYIK